MKKRRSDSFALMFAVISISANILKWILLIWTGVSLYHYSKEAFWGLFFLLLGIIIFADLKDCFKALTKNKSDKQ
jgi:hypothetical protein